MPAKGILAGKAFVELFADDSQLRRGLNAARRRLRAFGDTLNRMGRGLVLFGGLGAAAFIPTIKAASDAQETLSKFRAVFDEQVEAAEQFADSLAEQVGRSATEIKGSLANFQAFFKGLGFGGEEALKFSTALQELSIDFASFNNLSDAEAAQRFISALSGSSEVLAMFGINTKVAALEQELLARGITKSFSEVTEQQKAIARLNVIIGAMTDQGAVGDAVRTQSSFANQLKRASAEISDLKIAIGNALIPTLAPFLQGFGLAVSFVKDFVAANPALVTAVLATTVAVTALGAALVGLGAFATLVGGPVSGLFALIAAGAGTAAIAFGAMADSMKLSVENVIGLLGGLVKFLISATAEAFKFSVKLQGLLGLVKDPDEIIRQIDRFANIARGVAGKGVEAAIEEAIKGFRQFAIPGAGGGGPGGGLGGGRFGTFRADPREFAFGGQSPIQKMVKKTEELKEEVAAIRQNIDQNLRFAS